MEKIRLRHSTNNTGFTLIEVLVCVAILAGVVMTMFGVFTHLTLEIRRSRNRSMAAQAAQMIMESILASPYDAREFHGITSEDLPPSGSLVEAEILGWHHTLAAFPIKTVGQVAVEETPFCVDLETEEESFALCPELLQVTVNVRYQDRGREATQEVSLTLDPG